MRTEVPSLLFHYHLWNKFSSLVPLRVYGSRPLFRIIIRFSAAAAAAAAAAAKEEEEEEIERKKEQNEKEEERTAD